MLNGRFSSVQYPWLHAMLMCSAQHSTVQYVACRHSSPPACTSQNSHACCQQLTWTSRQDLSHKELWGCSSRGEEGWQHRLPFAMSIQTKVLSHWLLTSTISTHQLGALFATAGPTSFFLSAPPLCSGLSFSQSAAQSSPARRSPSCRRSHLLGSTVAPFPFADNWGWSASPVEVS